MAKPRVMTKCVANAYTGRNERIIEFASDGGGLISFRLIKGELVIDIYHCDPGVKVRTAP